MYRWFAFFIAGLLATLAGLAVWGLSGLTRDASLTLQKWGNAAPSKGKVDALAEKVSAALPAAGKLDQVATAAAGALGAASGGIARTTDNLNRPCRGAAGPDACGALAQLNKTEIKIGDAIVTTQDQERQAMPHMTAAMDAFRDAAFSLDDAGSSASSALDSFNDLLQSKDLTEAIGHANGMTGSGDAILADARQVADKMRADYLRPVPWWKQPVAKGGALIDITAAIARHTP